MHFSFNRSAKGSTWSCHNPSNKVQDVSWGLPSEVSLGEAQVFFPGHFSSPDSKTSHPPAPRRAGVSSGPIPGGLADAAQQIQQLFGAWSCCTWSCSARGEKSIGPVCFSNCQRQQIATLDFPFCRNIFGVFCLSKQRRLLCAFVVDWLPLCQQLVLVTLETALHPTEDFDRHILTEIALFSQFRQHTCS